MSSMMNWRRTGVLLERSTDSFLKLNGNEYACQYRMSPVYYDTPAFHYIPNGFCVNLPQKDTREIRREINQSGLTISVVNDCGFQMNPASKELIPHFEQRHGFAQPNLNPSADDFIRQSNQRHGICMPYPSLLQNLNPRAMEFNPQANQPRGVLPSHVTQSQNLNASAGEFIPQSKQRHDTFNSHLMQPQNRNHGAKEFIPQVPEDIEGAQRNNFLQEDHRSTQQIKWRNLNPNAKPFICQFRNLSEVAHKTDSSILNKCETSANSVQSSETQTEYRSPSCELSQCVPQPGSFNELNQCVPQPGSFNELSQCVPQPGSFNELNQDVLEPSLSAGQAGDALNGEFAMSSSAHAKDDIPTLLSTSATAAAAQAFAEPNCESSTNINLTKSDFCRTPRRPNNRCPRRDEADYEPEVSPPDSPRQSESLRIFGHGPYSKVDEFLHIVNQQPNTQSVFAAQVADEPEHHPTKLAARLESAEMETERLRFEVSTLSMDHALEKTRYQVQIHSLHKQMEAGKREMTNMKMLALDLLKQKTINRVDKMLMQAELQFKQLLEIMEDNDCTGEFEKSYEVLRLYERECDLFKLQIEKEAKTLRQKLENGQQVDMSVIEKSPPSFPELLL